MVHHHAGTKERRPRLTRVEAIQHAVAGERRGGIHDSNRPLIIVKQQGGGGRTEVRQRDEGAARIVQDLPREHPARQRQRRMSAGIVNGAGVIAAAAEKKCAAAVVQLRERAIRRTRDRSSHN